MPYHTYLNVIFEPLKDEIEKYNWIVTDLEFGFGGEDLPVDMEHDYFILSAADFKNLLGKNVQIWWGIIIAIPIDIEIQLDEDNLPCAEGNSLIWKNGNLQYPGAEIEVICFDSSYTIVKFTKEELSEKFAVYFNEAIALENFK